MADRTSSRGEINFSWRSVYRKQFLLVHVDQSKSDHVSTPSGIPPGQDTLRYSRHLTPNEKTTRLSGLHLYQDCLIIPPISSIFVCNLYINSQVTLDIKFNNTNEIQMSTKSKWPLLLSTDSLFPTLGITTWQLLYWVKNASSQHCMFSS